MAPKSVPIAIYYLQGLLYIIRDFRSQQKITLIELVREFGEPFLNPFLYTILVVVE